MRVQFQISTVRTLLLAALGPISLGACAYLEKKPGDSQLRPSEQAQDSIAPAISGAKSPSSEPDMIYTVPDTAQPEGRLTLRSHGLTRLATSSETEIPALHFEMRLENEGGALDWNLDIRLQQLRLGFRTPLRPVFVQASSRDLPFVTVPAGSKQTVDLYFRLPADDEDFQRARLDWQLVTGMKIVDGSSSFERIVGDEPAPRVALPASTSTEINKSNRDTESGSSTPSENPMAPANFKSWWQDPFTNEPEPWKETIR